MGATENESFPVVQSADTLIKNKNSPPFIVVAPSGGIAFYGNQYAGKFQFHDFFIDEFIPYIDATYRTRPDRPNRHIQGFSMGGYGAVMFAAKHPDLFGACTDIAGAIIGPALQYLARDVQFQRGEFPAL